MDNPDLDQLLPEWRVHLQAQRKSPETVRLYVNGVESFLEWFLVDRRPPAEPARLDKRSVEQFQNHLHGLGRAPATVHAYQKGVRRFSAWLVEEGELDTDPLLGIRPPKVDVPVIPSLDQDQLRALVQSCNGPGFLDRRDEAAVRLMTETGIRVGEAAGLAVTDVDVAQGLATVMGKGGKGRVVWFGPQTGRALGRYLRLRRGHRRAQEPALWLGDRGKACGTAALRRALERRAKMAGLEQFHPHVLRHTAASRWLAAGGSEGGLMAMAGWSNRSMMDRYVAANRAEQAAAESRGLALGEF